MWSDFLFRRQRCGEKKRKADRSSLYNDYVKSCRMTKRYGSFDSFFIFLEFVNKEKRASTPGGEMDALIQREWEKCSRSNKRGVCLVCDLFHILTLSRNNR